MNPKNKRTLFLTSTICIILSIVAFALSHMGGASNENYILLYVIAVLLNIVLNLALNIKIASTNGAKALVSLGKWIMPIAGVVYLIPQVYSVLFPAKTMQDTYWYVFIGILFIVSGNYFPKNHRTIDKSRLKNYIGHLNKDDMENINKTLLCSLGIT